MKDVKQLRQKGFTIIEVLIVLMIAGLIMVIVFLAVPALRRNARNTQYNTEARSILTAYSEISSNKGGSVLTTGNSGVDGDAKKVKEAANSKVIETVYISPYSTTSIGADSASGSSATNVDLTNAVLMTGAKCSAQDSGTATKGTSRQVAVFFAIETSSDIEVQCLDS
jgi:type IV pilus assembly protein PilA